LTLNPIPPGRHLTFSFRSILPNLFAFYDSLNSLFKYIRYKWDFHALLRIMLALKSPGFISYFSFISRFANIAPPNYSKIIPKDKSPAIKQMSATHHRPLSLSHLTPQGGVNIPTPAASYNSLPLGDPAGYKASETISRGTPPSIPS
jgi:hypothetical protein